MFGKYVADVIRNTATPDPVKLEAADIEKAFGISGDEISSDRIIEIRKQAALLLDKYLGVEREEKGLTTAVFELKKLLQEATASSVNLSNNAIFEKLSLENMLISAVALAESALLRNDSEGSHLRIDNPDPSENVYRTDVLLIGNEVAVSKINL